MPRYEISSPEGILPQELAMAKSILQQATGDLHPHGKNVCQNNKPSRPCEKFTKEFVEVNRGQNFGTPYSLSRVFLADVIKRQ
jgi:hypothetical protein